jgi:hypothetical protein
MGSVARLLRNAAVAVMCCFATALVLAACGSPSSPGVASVGTSTTKPAAATSLAARRLAYAKCVRSHGIPSFPDPSANGSFEIPAQTVNSSPLRYEAANKACTHLLPNGGKLSPSAMAHIATAALKFSACMRTHGVPGFPDPIILNESIGAGATATVGWKAGDYNRNSPQYQRANRICEPLMNGS